MVPSRRMTKISNCFALRKKRIRTIEILHEFEVVTMDLAKSIDSLMKAGSRRLDSIFNG